MLNNFFLCVLVALSLALGIVIGEGYAPLSRHTVYVIGDRVESLELKASAIERRCDRLEADVEKLTGVVFPSPTPPP